jgi:hypothetical protein
MRSALSLLRVRRRFVFVESFENHWPSLDLCSLTSMSCSIEGSFYAVATVTVTASATIAKACLGLLVAVSYVLPG